MHPDWLKQVRHHFPAWCKRQFSTDHKSGNAPFRQGLPNLTVDVSIVIFTKQLSYRLEWFTVSGKTAWPWRICFVLTNGWRWRRTRSSASSSRVERTSGYRGVVSSRAGITNPRPALVSSCSTSKPANSPVSKQHTHSHAMSSRCNTRDEPKIPRF